MNHSNRRSTALFFSVILTVFSLSLLAFPISAISEDTGNTFTYSTNSPIVSVYERFLSVYDEKAADIRIVCDTTEWYFPCENIFRNTEKWADFCSLVSVVTPKLPQGLFDALSGAEYLMIDFRDGDVFPGTAEIRIHTGYAGHPFALYEYRLSESQSPTLIPVVNPIVPDEDGTIILTLTEAHDFLLIEDSSPSLSEYCPTVSESPHFFFPTIWSAVLIVTVISAGAISTVLLVIRKKHRKKQSL